MTGRPRRAPRAAANAPRAGDPHARIHLAPVGFEVERVVEPIVNDRADRVYLVTRDGDDAAAPFVAEVQRRLARARWPVDVRVIPTPIWDVFGALGAYRRIFELEGRSDRNASGVVPIRVNVSTGTKITAIAGTLACMLWRGEPYYVQVSRSWYSGRTPRVQAVNDVVRSVDPVAVYELRAPSRELVDVLDALDRAGGTLRKRDLIRSLGLDRPTDGGRPPSPQAQHSRLRLRLTPLESKWGFLAADPTGSRGRVRLTPQGRLALTLFGRSRGDDSPT
ncbi:MAG: DUF6293 family protein [Thermoplasmata archaeon]|nr:DUF6293 family protein [Thermoplasmata archaeon]MCI4356140.1 DUF6293 family protein [Thermoplasmata archaeon]